MEFKKDQIVRLRVPGPRACLYRIESGTWHGTDGDMYLVERTTGDRSGAYVLLAAAGLVTLPPEPGDRGRLRNNETRLWRIHYMDESWVLLVEDGAIALSRDSFDRRWIPEGTA